MKKSSLTIDQNKRELHINYRKLSYDEKIKIDYLRNCDHKSVNQIAKILKRNKSTISREIKRNSNSEGSYQFNFAQEKSKSKQLHKFFFRVEKYNDFLNLLNKYYDKRIHGVKVT
ncbi:helix-turn-helix domain-containing protein [Candidatus Mycoplasma pogonae]